MALGSLTFDLHALVRRSRRLSRRLSRPWGFDVGADEACGACPVSALDRVRCVGVPVSVVRVWRNGDQEGGAVPVLTCACSNMRCRRRSVMRVCPHLCGFYTMRDLPGANSTRKVRFFTMVSRRVASSELFWCAAPAHLPRSRPASAESRRAWHGPGPLPSPPVARAPAEPQSWGDCGTLIRAGGAAQHAGL